MTGRLALFAAALLLLAGCGTTRPSFVAPGMPPGFPNHSASFISRAVEKATQPLTSFASKSRMRFKTPEESRSVNLEIKYRRADTLLVSARVTLGIEAFRSLITPDSFFVYDRLNKKLYHGPASEAYLLLPTPGPLDEMFESITGTIEVDANADWQVSHDSSYYYLVTGDLTKSVTVDPRLWRVIESEARTSSGDLIERRTYSDFDLFSGYVIPRRVEVDRPLAGERFQVYHRSFSVNPRPLTFDFDVGRVDENILVGDDY